MNRPLLSICIPTYNRAEYLLKECLDSIVCQFDDENIHRQVEIVISDNASSDNTTEVVRVYQDKFDNIKYFRKEVEIPGGQNWDNAVAHSFGRYINVIGDDDIYLPDSLDKILPVLLVADAALIAVAHVQMINGEVRLDSGYCGEIKNVSAEAVAKGFFGVSEKKEEKNMELGPGFLFFSGDLAREIKNRTGYFWKEPICDHWAIFSVLYEQMLMTFYDFPIVACRVHEGNHLATKYKSKFIERRLNDFLQSQDREFNLFPGPSFSNLGYVGMQDIQDSFPAYKKFPINTDKCLYIHIHDLFHSDFSIKDKWRYMFKSFVLIKKKKLHFGVKLLIEAFRFVFRRKLFSINKK